MKYISLYYINPNVRKVSPELYNICDNKMSFNVYSDDTQKYLGCIVNQTIRKNDSYESDIIYIKIDNKLTDKYLMMIMSFYLRMLRLSLIGRDIDYRRVNLRKHIHSSERLYNLLCKRFDIKEITQLNSESYSFGLLRGDWE